MARMTYRGREVGTADEAAAVCGVKKDTYYYYVKRLGAPDGIRYRHPDTGEKLYDLAKVQEWQDARPGKGARTDVARKRREAELRQRARGADGRFAPSGSEPADA
ncbi:hypothetical protein [Pseudonocardia sp. NPDC049635]|uniref:hypothetical protein n=1 Tax=Pseudonocardia sp. NPDC049635 TaxID=3155506 RepID=UPI0033D93704